MSLPRFPGDERGMRNTKVIGERGVPVSKVFR